MTDTPQPKRRSDRAFWLMMATLGAMLVGLVIAFGVMAGERGWMF